MGARAGAGAFIGAAATGSYGDSLAGRSQSEIDAALAAFRAFLGGIGTPGFQDLMKATAADDLAAYGSVYTEAVRIALLTSGIGALVASVIAGIALGPSDPLKTVWELQDERSAPGGGATTAEPPSSAGPVASQSGR
jgi:hypothetical protein